MAIETPWSTSYPGAQDTPGSEQPDLTKDSAPDVKDGDRVLDSHPEALRDKLQALAVKVGDDGDLPAGSHAAKITALEVAPPAHAHLEADIADLDHFDATAVHTDEVSEIATLADEASPADTDLFIMERAGDGAKRKVEAQNLPGGAGLGVTVLLDLDFTAEATQNLITGGDGNKTIGGKTFYVDNTGNATKFAVTNGVGLEMDHDATNTSVFGTTRTGLIAGIRLTDLGIDFQDLSFVRVWMIFSHNVDQDFEHVQLGFERKHIGGFVGATWHYWAGARSFESGQRWSGAFVNVNGVGSDGVDTTDLLNDDVMMVKLYSAGTFEFYTGVSTGGNFPSAGDMRLRNRGQFSDDEAMRMTDASEMAAWIATKTSNTNGNLETTVTRMKVDAK